MKIRSILILSIFISVSIILVPSISMAKVKFVYGHTGAQYTSTEFMAQDFKRRVERYSNGEMLVDVHGAGTLGSDIKLLSSLKLGTIDMCMTSNSNYASAGKGMRAFDLPYLIHGRYNFFLVMTNPKVRKEISKRIWKDGFKFLAGHPQCAGRSLQNRDRVIHAPADAKGLKVRVTASPIAAALLKAWGMVPVQISWGETYLSIKQGIVDGCYIQDAYTYISKLYEVCKYTTYTGGMVAPTIHLMNKDRWNKLSPEQQEIIDRAAYDADLGTHVNDAYVTDYARRKMKEGGHTFIYPNLEEQLQWREAGMKIWDEQINRLGLDRNFIKLIQEVQIPPEEY